MLCIIKHIYVFRYTYTCMYASVHCGLSMPGTDLLSECLDAQMFSGSCGGIFCYCPSQRTVGCIAYGKIMLPPCCWRLWQCCAIVCCDCISLATLNEAGPQQDLGAWQACPGSAEAKACVQQVAQSGTDPLSLRGGFGHSSVKELGVRGAWGEMLHLGYNVCSSACVGVAEDPMVLLEGMLCNPGALAALQQQ